MKRKSLTPQANTLETLILPASPRILVPFVTGNKLSPYDFLSGLRKRLPGAHLTLATAPGIEPHPGLSDAHLAIPPPTRANIWKILSLAKRMHAARYDLCFLPEEEIYGPDFGSVKKYVFSILSGAQYTLTGTLQRNRAVNVGYGARSTLNQAMLLYLVNTPVNLQIESTNRCNLRCPLCPTGTGLVTEQGAMDFARYSQLIHEVGDSTETLALYNLGEPLLHPEITAMIALAKQKNIFVRIDSNLSLPIDAPALVQSGLDVIQVAVDGTTEESYKKYRRNGRLHTVLTNISRLVEEKKKAGSPTPLIVLKFIAMRHNEHEVEKARKLAASLEVDHFSVEGVTIPSFAREHWQEFLPEQEQYNKYESAALRERRQLIFKNAHPGNRCSLGLQGTLVLWNGDVKACCRNSYRTRSFGNAFTDGGLKAVWSSKPYRQFRKQLRKNRSLLRECRGCWL